MNPDNTTMARGTSAMLARATHGSIIGAERDAGSGESFALVDPSDERVLGHVTPATPGDVDRAVAAARAALDGPWGGLSPHERGLLIGRLADALEEHATDLAELEAVTAGKPIRDVLSYDLPRTIEHFRYFAGWPGKLYGETIPVPQNAVVTTQLEPVGVVGQIVPWNFPLMIAAWKVAPALAAGCTIVLKPALETPLSALMVAELAEGVGLPPGVLNVVVGGAETGATLAEHGDVDKLSFTGSTAVGREIVRASAGNLKRLSLELGGKSPLIVFPDADLDRAIASATNAAFFHSGQVCVAGSRLLVHRDVFDVVVAGVAERAGALRTGPVLDHETQLGPLISERHLQRVTRYVDEEAGEGVEVVTGGGRPAGAERGWWFSPTVVVDPGRRSRITREEVFGPVLAVHPFADEDEAVEHANATRYGLTSGVFTRDMGRAYRVAKRLKAGTVWLNTYMQGDSAVPTGGWKESGYGHDRGRDALMAYESKKIVWASLD